METYQVDFQPVGRRGQCRPDQSLLEAAQQVGVDLMSVCGGIGICGRCVVQVLAGRVSQPTPAELDSLSQAELDEGYRLACRTYPLGPLTLDVPTESLSTPMRTQVEGLEAEVVLDPPVSSVDLQLQTPSLSRPLADAETLLRQVNRLAGLDAQIVDITVLKELSTRLREWKWDCTAHVRGREVIAVTPTRSRALGLAVDLGSTKIAGYLLDLRSGQSLAARGIMNPQIGYGEDIISRVTYAMKSPGGRDKMQAIVLEALNQLIADMCAEVGAVGREILEAVIVGNTAMHHLLLGLPVRQLALSPFVPALSGDLDIKARDLGLHIAPGAYVYLPPNIAGFVGSDHIAMLLATTRELTHQSVIALDIGTNTEISLITPDGDITSLSCASGPAFEGYHIKDGTRATTGAIERVRITLSEVHYKTIQDAPPSGICGSGILDVVAQLHLAGVLSDNGRMQVNSHPRVRQNGDEREFVLVEADEGASRKEIVVTQSDVREIQLAKGSIETGIRVLLTESGTSVQDVDQVIIAGAFGTYIDVSNAVAMGMLPDIPLDRFKQVGNAAGIGAKLVLLSTRTRSEARTLRARIRYVELAQYPKFARLFAQSCQLKPYIPSGDLSL
jgi:uncharacterized 2Fe-2S/4Fe-4S cluster protein (DUF4445 family)